MSTQARPPRRATATNSGNHFPIGVYELKDVIPQSDVLPIKKPEDSNRCGKESEIGDKSADEKGGKRS